MKPPTCRLCKNAHWPRDPHRWDEIPVALTLSPLDHPHEHPAAPSVEEEILIHGWNPAAPDPPHSNAQSPSRRTRDTDNKQARSEGLSTLDETPLPDNPDTAPSVIDLSPQSVMNKADVRNMTDEQLLPYFNEVMRRRMKARRAKQKDTP